DVICPLRTSLGELCLEGVHKIRGRPQEGVDARVTIDLLKAPASKSSQGSVRLSWTKQIMPEWVPSNSLANWIPQRVPLGMSSDDTHGSTKRRTAGTHSLRLRTIR